MVMMMLHPWAIGFPGAGAVTDSLVARSKCIIISLPSRQASHALASGLLSRYLGLVVVGLNPATACDDHSWQSCLHDRG
jgi:hypothetical protein